MSDAKSHGPLEGSEPYRRLCEHFEEAGGSITTLRTVLWKIGAHPQLIGHATVFQHLLALLHTDVFAPGTLAWASSWREEVPSWSHALRKIDDLEQVLLADPALEPMFRIARRESDHPLLRHGVTRHPIAAALFNSPEIAASDLQAQHARDGYQLARAHVVAIHSEARARAATGIDEFMQHSGLKEFAPVPVGSGPVGLALREFSLARYAPLMRQLPTSSSTIDFAFEVFHLRPDFSCLPAGLRADAARYFESLRNYFSTLPALLTCTNLTPRKRAAGETEGSGGSELRPGWVGWAEARIERTTDIDWTDDAPPVTIISLPSIDEPDDKQEEAEGECPRLARDDPLETYDPTTAQRRASRMRLRQIVVENKSQQLTWSMDVATGSERARALQVAQASIDLYLHGGASNQSKARLFAVGGVLVKAMAVFGWLAESTANIAVLPVAHLDAGLVDSLAYVRQDQITLLVLRDSAHVSEWRPAAFLVPALTPTYQTKLADTTAAVGRLRQTAFLITDASGLGQDLLSIAVRSGKLVDDRALVRRALGVENKTARSLARDCLAEAADPINEDPRAKLTPARLTASVLVAICQVSHDLVPAWMIGHQQARTSEPRLYYTQLRAARLAQWHAEALATLEGDSSPTTPPAADAQSIAGLQHGWVGCRFVADLERVREVIARLQKSLRAPADFDRRTVLRRYHNHFTLHAWLMQALPLALRPVAAGPGVSQVVERVRGTGSWSDVHMAGVSDKHNGYQNKSRLIPISETTVTVATELEQHNACVITRLALHSQWQTLEPSAQRSFAILDDEQLTAVTPEWITRELAALGLPVPCNFGRALLRTEWLHQGCHGRLIDAHMGHYGHYQNPFSKHSSHDPSAHLAAVRGQLPRYLAHLGLTTISSLLVPTADRHASLPIAWQLPVAGLKHTVHQPKLRPIWWTVDKPPVLPEPAAGVWALVRRHAANADQAVLDPLLWTLARSSNPHAQLLTGRAFVEAGAADDDSARALVNEVLLTVQRHRLPQTCAASWLRLLLASQKRLQARGVELVNTPVAALTTEPSSPVSPHATQRLPDIAHWRSALHAWVRERAANPQDDPKYWAIAIGLSAVLNGMLLDALLLSRFLEYLATPGPRRLQRCGAEGEFAFLEFRMPSEAPGGRQLVRWFVDPLTELLVLQAPPFPDVPTLRGTSRYLNPFLRHHGTPRHRCPGGWRNVIAAARGFWSTRVPQYLVQAAQRGLSTTSLEEDSWRRIFGHVPMRSDRPGAPPHDVSASNATLTLEDLRRSSDEVATPAAAASVDRTSAIAGATVSAGVDVEHYFLDQQCARPWLMTVSEILARPMDTAIGELKALGESAAEGSFESGACRWLARTAAAWETEKRNDDPTPRTLVDLRRVSSTLLPCLALELGDRWFDSRNSGEFARVSDALRHEPIPGRSRQILRRGLDLLRRHEPLCMAPERAAESATVPVDALEDIEDPGHDVRVDARIITIDEYRRALTIIHNGIEPPLRPQDREALEDLLDLGAWSLARPREYLEARLGDFDLSGGGLSLSVRAYAGHDLKTNNGVRNVPFSLLAPAEATERLRARIAKRLSEHSHPDSAEARRQLLFRPSSDSQPREHHDRLLSLLRRILRNVTGDSTMRVYSLRHSGANWLFLALEAQDDEITRSLWSKHPEMQRWITQGSQLRQRLLGSSDRTDRRACMAITKLMGHMASATTFMHYLHTTSMLQLQAVRRLANDVPDAVMAAAARISSSTYSEQMLSGWATVLRNARSRADWTAEDESTALSQGLATSSDESRWLSFENLTQLVNAHARFAQPIADIGRHFAMSETAVQIALDLADELAEAGTPEAKPDGTAAGAQIQDYRMNEAERLQLYHLTLNIEALWRRCPLLARQGVQLMIRQTNRHHREFSLNQPSQLALLCEFLEGIGAASDEVQIVLRRRDASATVPSWALEPLGMYRDAAVEVRAPDTASSDAALERWLSIRLVDRKGHGIPNIVSRALFAARVNMEVWDKAA